MKEGKIDFSEGGLDWKELKEVTRFYFVACGSAYHVSLVAKNVIEDLMWQANSATGTPSCRKAVWWS